MRIVNGIELDDGVDEPDTCRECGTWMMGCGYAPLCDSCCDSQPNNRPEDGKVCDCEDAPCCGHYKI